MINKPFAEVIQSTLAHYTAQCWEWDQAPAFGSLVQATLRDVAFGSSSERAPVERTIFGLVTSVTTGSSDPMRTPFAYKKTEAQLKAEQPHIFEFLQTNFIVHVVGYKQEQGALQYIIPPTPCKIHSFVSTSNPETMQQFFAQPDFLHLLFSFAPTILYLDELLLAIINQLAQNNMVSQEKIDDFCKLFSLLTSNDYRRLKVFLKRVEPLLK